MIANTGINPSVDIESDETKRTKNEVEESESREPHESGKRNRYASNLLCDGQDYFPGQYGTYAAIVLLIIGMVASVLGLNYAPRIQLSQWLTDCPVGYDDACKSSGAVFRFSFALTSVFIIQLVGVAIFTKFYDYLWWSKFLAFAALVIGYFFIKAEVFNLNGFAWYARVCGFFYLIIQQVILIDFAYYWNDKWVKWSEEDVEHGYGNYWLGALLFIAFIIIGGSISVVGVMYWQFDCADTKVIISMTIILCFIATMIQIFVSDEGSIMTSAIIIGYSTYVCYSSITLQPFPECNPTISTGFQTVSQAIGMGLLIISLIWSSFNSSTKMRAVASAVSPQDGSETTLSPYNAPGLKLLFLQMCVVYILICSYFAMVLTNWATLQADFQASSARQGLAAMWIQAAGQWIAILLYIWTLIAPKLFPDRDFKTRG
mmetsp:Transcript_23504/g.22645  ORF Transcript_23504/g.22645 Transcript_23504/m.22645 type:complete len:431 (-) Transcript_23504:139-1431(-)